VSRSRTHVATTKPKYRYLVQIFPQILYTVRRTPTVEPVEFEVLNEVPLPIFLDNSGFPVVMTQSTDTPTMQRIGDFHNFEFTKDRLEYGEGYDTYDRFASASTSSQEFTQTKKRQRKTVERYDPAMQDARLSPPRRAHRGPSYDTSAIIDPSYATTLGIAPVHLWGRSNRVPAVHTKCVAVSNGLAAKLREHTEQFAVSVYKAHNDARVAGLEAQLQAFKGQMAPGVTWQNIV
jgi:hypothetical protein